MISLRFFLLRCGLLSIVLLIGGCQSRMPTVSAASRWTVIGPGGGGAQYHPTISPHDSSLVLVNCDMTGAYISHDAGATWRMFNLRGRVRFFAFDPVSPRTIYAQTTGLWRSDDTGATWRLIYPDPQQVTGISKEGDHAEESFLTANGPADRITALAIDPADSKILYAAFQRSGETEVRTSADRGKSWSLAGKFAGIADQLYIDPGSPPNKRSVYVAGPRGVHAYENGKWQAWPLPQGLESLSMISLAAPKTGGAPVIWGVTEARWEGEKLRGGILLSEDGGRTWTEAAASLSGELRPGVAPKFIAIASPRKHPGTAYVSYGAMFRSGGAIGVMRTQDSGKTWVPVWKESREKSPQVDDGWISQRFGAGWGENPLDLGCAPDNPNLCYGTDYGRTLRTTDGGRTWKAMYTKAVGNGFTTTGLDVTTAHGVFFDPFDAKRIFIAYTDIGLFRSEDSGRSWQSSTVDGVPPRWVNTTYWMAFDPQVRGRVWAVMSGTHDLPRPKMFRRTSPSRYRGGVLRSDDGGLSWHVSGDGLPETAPTYILLDSRSPKDSRVLYVAAFGRGVYKSTDGGKSWHNSSQGLPEQEPFAFQLAQDSKGILYVVIARRREGPEYGGAGDGALYRSTDQGAHWEPVRLPDGVNGPNGLAVDPRDPKRLVLAAWGRAVAPEGKSGGIWLSTDGGGHWRNTLIRDQHVFDVVFDPRDSRTLYATGFESSVWKSTDRGETWRRLPGYNFKWGQRVVPDPHDASRIYVATFGGSVWLGPANGVNGAVEDIVTPQVSYSGRP